MSYKIAFIDEDESQNEDFQLYFEEYSDVFEVLIIDPRSKSKDEIVDEVIASRCDVIAIDYYLRYSSSKVDFNGDELLLRFKERKLNMPLIILTSDTDKASTEGSLLPPNFKIFDKTVLDNIKDESFKNELLAYIQYYKNLEDEYKKEFSELTLRQKKGEILTGKEKRRIILLNSLLSEMRDRESIIEPFEDQEIHLQKVNELVDQTKELLKSLKGDV
ncbi:MAG: hypothetical protein RIG77_08995 [Cyclobacteriaceae bacterium]